MIVDRWGVTPIHEVRKHLQSLSPIMSNAMESKKYRRILNILSSDNYVDDAKFEEFISEGNNTEKMQRNESEEHGWNSLHSVSPTSNHKLDSSMHTNRSRNGNRIRTNSSSVQIVEAIAFPVSSGESHSSSHIHQQSHISFSQLQLVTPTPTPSSSSSSVTAVSATASTAKEEAATIMKMSSLEKVIHGSKPPKI